MSNSTETHHPMSTRQAVEAVRHGAWLWRAHLSDFKELLTELGTQVPGLELRMIACRIDEAECQGVEVLNPLNFGPVFGGRSPEQERTIFTGHVSLGSAKFKYPVVFDWVKFTRGVVFSAAVFEHEALFHHAMFVGTANFVFARFKSQSHFLNATFEGGATFYKAIFEFEAQFPRVHFRQEVNFQAARFRARAFFTETIFDRWVDFDEAHLHSGADFGWSQINGFLKLEGVKLDRRCNLDFSGAYVAPAGEILLSMTQIGWYQRPNWTSRWPGRTTRERRWLYRGILTIRKYIRRRWPSVKLIEGEDSSDPHRLRQVAIQYNILRDNFRGQPSREMEEDRCHYKYRDLMRRATPNRPLWSFLDWFVMKWCLGYAIYTRRILWTMIGVMFAFAGIYSLAVRCCVESLIRNYDMNFNSLYFSVITFTTVGYGDYAPRGWLRIASGLEGLLGVILVAMFTVSFARKLIR